MSESLGLITEIATGTPDGAFAMVTTLDPPLDATPECLAKLAANPWIGGYRIKFAKREPVIPAE